MLCPHLWAKSLYPLFKLSLKLLKTKKYLNYRGINILTCFNGECLDTSLDAYGKELCWWLCRNYGHWRHKFHKISVEFEKRNVCEQCGFWYDGYKSISKKEMPILLVVNNWKHNYWSSLTRLKRSMYTITYRQDILNPQTRTWPKNTKEKTFDLIF